MPDAISNTSPLVYLHRIEAIGWLPMLFSSIWVLSADAQLVGPIEASLHPETMV